VAMTQAESYADLWGQHRDYAGPVKADDVFALRDDRDFQPPSRAHIKRIERARPEITLASRPRLSDTVRRREINQALAFAKRAGLVPQAYVARPLEKGEQRVRIDASLGAPLTDEQRELRAAQRFAEASRLASYGMIAVGRLPHMADAMRTYLNI
jgi:hypothetical protein